MQRVAKIETRLEALFPSSVRVCFSDAMSPGVELLAEEAVGTDKMVEQRLQEYGHGRACARAVLAMLGLQGVAIPRGKSREPLWPRGIVGSISHSGSAAAAVAARIDDLSGIGLDIENAAPLDEELIALICRPDERVFNNATQAKLIFSIKEAIYKSIFPCIGEFVDFQEVRVHLDEKNSSFVASTDSPKPELGLVEALRGRYDLFNGMVACAAWLPVKS